MITTFPSKPVYWEFTCHMNYCSYFLLNTLLTYVLSNNSVLGTKIPAQLKKQGRNRAPSERVTRPQEPFQRGRLHLWWEDGHRPQAPGPERPPHGAGMPSRPQTCLGPSSPQTTSCTSGRQSWRTFRSRGRRSLGRWRPREAAVSPAWGAWRAAQPGSRTRCPLPGERGGP